MTRQQVEVFERLRPVPMPLLLLEDKMTRVFDCFTFDNEALIYARIALLGPHVDVFYVVEGSHTFQGVQKVQAFDIEKVPAEFQSQVSYHLVDLSAALQDGDPWHVETVQRNALMGVLAEANDEDIIILSDVDEIPNPSVISKMHISAPARLHMLNCYFYYNYICETNPIWRGALIFRKSFVKEGVTFQNLRSGKLKSRMLDIHNAGWHLSYLGGVDSIYEKLAKFSHTELSGYKDVTRETYLQKIQSGRDVFDRRFKWGTIPADSRLFETLLSSDFIRNFKAPSQTRKASLVAIKYHFAIHVLKGAFKRILSKIKAAS